MNKRTVSSDLGNYVIEIILSDLFSAFNNNVSNVPCIARPKQNSN